MGRRLTAAGGTIVLMRRALLAACVIAAVRSAYADEKSPPIAAPPAGSSEPHWLIYGALVNDAFSELIPPLDDQGFTHDTVLAIRREQTDWLRDALGGNALAGIDQIGGSAVHRIITSRGDRRRWDLAELFATAEHVWPLALPLSATLRAGPTFAGNLGGRYIQNGWHSISKTGPTVEQGLQNMYPGDRRFAFTLGARVGADTGEQLTGWLRGYGFVDGQVALGSTGVTSMQSALGISAAQAHVGAHAELALARYDVDDPDLALPGAYRAGWQAEWRVGVDLHWSHYRAGYEYRANESGSGEPVGLVEFSTTQ